MREKNITPEEWRPVVGWEGVYEVSDRGRVRSLDRISSFMRLGRRRRCPHRGVLLKPSTSSGYCQVTLLESSPKRLVYRKVHQLVLEAFVGPRPAGQEGCHEDNIKTNNHLENLRWDTKAGNMADKHRHGTMHRHPGESCPTSKLRNEDIYRIRELGEQGMKHGVIAGLFGVCRSNISQILRGVSWTHI